MKKKAEPYLSLEKVSDGIIISIPGTKKIHRRTLNGVINYIQKYWGIKYIEVEIEKLTDVSSGDAIKEVEEMLSSDKKPKAKAIPRTATKQKTSRGRRK